VPSKRHNAAKAAERNQMRAKALKEKYPQQWESVETQVKSEIDSACGKSKNYLKYCDEPKLRERLRIVAYNAAATAVMMLHAELKKQKAGTV
jgi:hypothetical protein